MAKKPETREALLAKLEALDNDTEVTRLTAEVSRLTAENTALASKIKEHERELSKWSQDFETIRKAVRLADGRRTRTYGGVDHATDPANIAARMGMAHVSVGIQRGTHDPLTGLEYTKETAPQRELSAGTPKVTAAELEKFFPELAKGPTLAPLGDQPIGDDPIAPLVIPEEVSPEA